MYCLLCLNKLPLYSLNFVCINKDNNFDNQTTTFSIKQTLGIKNSFFDNVSLLYNNPISKWVEIGFGTKRGKCGFCEKCYEYTPPADGTTLACVTITNDVY